ncbi:hypothetical protein ABIE44_002765 [Marmoricola sp. OAE513]|uniref:T3SS (YopN, CesT) and YbjN peptide-binding chaperone 1 n=1 Tax=Marmoricola sp. OAE513 TaxID=2817894 RepID=UPI001AE89037
MHRDADLATSTDQAWKRFRADLAETIAEREEDVYVLWELDVPERHAACCGPYVLVTWEPDEAPLVQVSSNKVLDHKFRLDKAARRALKAAGWNKPDAGHLNYWRELADLAYVDEVAHQLVQALRDVLGVVHPAFLVDRYAEDLEASLPPSEDEDDEPTEPETTELLPLAVMPRDHEHLVEMVDLALGSECGNHPPKHDDDGDIPFRSGTAVVFVRVLDDAPVIRVFAEIAVGVTNPDAAAFEVAVLNRDNPIAKFVLRDDRIIMSCETVALPFVPDLLRGTVSGMCDLAPKIDADLAHRVGGRRFLDPVEDDAA